MVLLERLGLLSEIHNDDDKTSGLHSSSLNYPSQIKQSGKETLPDKQRQQQNQK